MNWVAFDRRVLQWWCEELRLSHQERQSRVQGAGFTLNYEALQTLNYYTMRDNILKELNQPMQRRREMAITIPEFFDRDQTTKKINLTQRVKKYGLVFDRRVIDTATRVSTPYGYNWFGGDA